MVKSYILDLCMLRMSGKIPVDNGIGAKMSDAQREAYFTQVKPMPAFIAACDNADVETAFAKSPLDALVVVYTKHPELKPVV